MDATIKRIVEEVVKEFHLEPGFLMRVVELEETKAHLVRRHGLFEDLRELSRKAAQRELTDKRMQTNED